MQKNLQRSEEDRIEPKKDYSSVDWDRILTLKYAFHQSTEGELVNDIEHLLKKSS